MAVHFAATFQWILSFFALLIAAKLFSKRRDLPPPVPRSPDRLVSRAINVARRDFVNAFDERVSANQWTFLYA